MNGLPDLDVLIDDVRKKIIRNSVYGYADSEDTLLFKRCFHALEEYRDYRWKNENKGAFFSGNNIHEKVKQTDI